MNVLAWFRKPAQHSVRQRFAAFAITALAFTTFAFAAHLHALDQGTDEARDAICAFCLHAERLGTAPDPLVLELAAPPSGTAMPRALRPEPRPVPAHRYHSRAPPT